MTCAVIADIAVILAWACAALIAALILAGIFSYSALLRHRRRDPMLAILDDVPRAAMRAGSAVKFDASGPWHRPPPAGYSVSSDPAIGRWGGGRSS